MKSALIFLLGILVLIVIWWRMYQPPKTQEVSSTSTRSKTVEQFDEPNQSRSLFVPYWTLGKEKIDTELFDKIIYFGLAPTESGIDEKDDGNKKLQTFLKLAGNNRDKYIAVRMLSSKTNFTILENKDSQKKIIDEVIQIAKENSFSGIVLDLEVISLPFDSVINEINDFSKLFYESSKQNKLTFSIMLYGDSFYRVRPYDVKSLGKNADTLYVMSYDFSKSQGNPGPNFPLEGKDKYGYDFKTMVDDFSRIVGREKLVIVFGLFGYDWTVDEKSVSKGQATPFSLNEAKQKFVDNCNFNDCVVKRSSESAEMQVTYTDINGSKHVAWFEDLDSVSKKKEYLKQKGINTLGFWAYSYF